MIYPFQILQDRGYRECDPVAAHNQATVVCPERRPASQRHYLLLYILDGYYLTEPLLNQIEVAIHDYDP